MEIIAHVVKVELISRFGLNCWAGDEGKEGAPSPPLFASPAKGILSQRFMTPNELLEQAELEYQVGNDL